MSSELFQTGLYYFFAVVAVGSSGLVAFSRNLAHAIFMLLFALGSVAAFYALLGADFLFAAQVLIYVGGVLVILIFAMMISEEFPVGADDRATDKSVAGFITSFLVLTVCLMVAWGTQWPEVGAISVEPTTTELGKALLSEYLLPFEIAGLLLLVALIGATMMTRLDQDEPHPNIEYQRDRERDRS
jgi:NADH-quinone oxidoreductase subunit J